MAPDSSRDQSPGLDDGRLMFAFAHDIRALLRTVLTRIQLVQSGSAGLLPERDRDFLTEAADAAKDVNGLLSSMVAYCGVTPGGPSTGLVMMLRGLDIELKDDFEAAGAKVEYSNSVDVQVPRVLKTVLKELLVNACRFRRTDAALEIQVHITVSSDAVLLLSVTDNGLGVEQPYLERIFEPFQRLQSRSQYPGYGLGLALCRRIVSMNGGTIDAQPAQDSGVTFRVTMPLAQTV